MRQGPGDAGRMDRTGQRQEAVVDKAQGTRRRAGHGAGQAHGRPGRAHALGAVASADTLNQRTAPPLVCSTTNSKPASTWRSPRLGT